MRLIHTSDWHLGRRLHDHSLIEAQAHALDQIARLCLDEGADALLVAGDLFDRAVPPEEAVRLFNDFLLRMSKDVRIPVVAIAGNHDSAERLGFASDFLALGRIHLRTRLSDRAEPVVIEAGGEVLHVYALPYVEPLRVRAELQDESLRGHEEAIRAALRRVRERLQPGTPSVLMAHLFASGGSESPDSERSLEIGGAAQVSAEALDGFSYVALGHLHAPQRVAGREDIRYSGSLLKYSVGEANQRKGVTLVELGRGPLAVREVPLTPLKDVVRLEGSLHDLLHAPDFERVRGDFVEAIYTDTGHLLDVASRLRERFPNLLAARPRALLLEAAVERATPRPELALRDTRELLEGFWSHVLQESAPLDESHHAVFREVVGRLERHEDPDADAQEAA